MAEGKVFLLGIDGGDMETVKRLVKEGELLAFEELMKGGSYGKAESTMPPISCPAWSCIFTGLSPGSLGAADYLTLDENYRQVRSPRGGGRFLWDLLPVRVGMVGLMTLSVSEMHPTDGFVASGLSEKANLQPSDLKLERRKKPLGSVKLGSRLRIIRENFEVDKDAIQQLIGKKWDLFISVLTVVDSTSHFTDRWENIETAYKKVDEYISILLEELEDDCNLIACSDHGLKEIKRKFYVNTFLEKHGLLKRKQKWSFPFIKPFGWLARKAGKSEFVRGLIPRWKGTRLASLNMLNMRETRIFGYGSSGSSYCKLWINSRDRFKKGAVKGGDLEDAKLGLINAAEDEEMIDAVLDKDEAWNSTDEKLPDLLLKLRGDCVDDYKLVDRIEEEVEGFAHSMEGLFMAYGPDIKPLGDIGKFRPKIYDVAPTIMHYFGGPIPESVGGRVLREIFRKGSPPAEREVERRDVEKVRLRKRIKELKARGILD